VRGCERERDSKRERHIPRRIPRPAGMDPSASGGARAAGSVGEQGLSERGGHVFPPLSRTFPAVALSNGSSALWACRSRTHRCTADAFFDSAPLAVSFPAPIALRSVRPPSLVLGSASAADCTGEFCAPAGEAGVKELLALFGPLKFWFWFFAARVISKCGNSLCIRIIFKI